MLLHKFEITQQSSCWRMIGVAISCSSHFCRPSGIATSWSTHYQQMIGVAKICVSNYGDVVWIRQSTERWNLVGWKQCILLALIFYRGRSPRVEWKHCFQLALIFYRSSAHKIENVCTLSQLHTELPSLISLCRFPFGIATSRSTHCLENFCTLSQMHVELSSKTLVESPQICDQIEVTMPIYLPQNLLNELIVDNRLSFHLWR